MSHPSRIKVSDLLLHVGQSDDIVIDAFMLPSIPHLDDAGIHGMLHLQSIDKFTIVATLENIVCCIDDVSDISGTTYKRSVRVATFLAYFVLASHDTISHEEEDSPIFTIDDRSETIDVSEMMYQCIVLQEPFVKRTLQEERLLDTSDSDDLDTFDDTQVGGAITFTQG